MRNRQKAIFLSADQLEAQATARVTEAERLPPGEARRDALKNAAQLRSYAAMKRLLAPDRPSVSAKAKGMSDVDN